ncbi:MAG: ATP-binding protein [Deltaproteobacteria bacterium]|nr:ATP-binding protein [Deltaproteobacteria bacterium]
MTEIRDLLIDMNPWWKAPHALSYYDREAYSTIQKFLPLPQIIVLSGLRRLGKTTLMLKIVADSIADGLDSKRVCYFSFDEFKQLGIRGVIDQYEAVIGLNFSRGQYLLLLDEIQKLSNWEDQLKSLYDIYKGKVKIIASGSESLFIKKKSKETLSGRLFEFKVDFLTFKEFLRFKKLDLTPANLYSKELGKLFDEFILTLGFPELVGIGDKEIIKKYIDESIVGRIVFKDIPEAFNIRDISVLESLLQSIMEAPGQLIELSELAKVLRVSRQTVSNYLRYLEESYLVRKVYNFSNNWRKTERKLKKYYPAIIDTTLLFKEDTLSRSTVFECLLVNQLKADFFWRDPYKNEVDVILRNKVPIPVEIKYGKLNYKGLRAFMNKFDIRKGTIISYREETEYKSNDKTIRVIPAFKYFGPGS